MKEYEVVIIGGGPAGLTAGLYTSRARRTSLLIEKQLVGGLITSAGWVENFPGFPDGVAGLELGELLHKQATRYGLETIIAEVSSIELSGEQKVIATTEGEFAARTVIIASGSERSKLGIPGEEEFTGRGVSYCATCDAAFFAEQPVAVVGGGDAAVHEALDIVKYVSKAFIIHRRDKLRASRILQERAFAEPKIDIRWNTVVDEIEGTNTVKQLKLRDTVTSEKTTLEVSGVFIAVGFKPNTDFVKGLVSLDDTGQIVTNEHLETKIAGIFSAGDVRSGSGRQAITAAGEGATAAIYAERYLSG
ncbi:MAG TPA: thioredoxin-disulfide reductase [Dehalococcoidia bacterium]|nr:thioredoxin-disulfide reductase [Dehalococcoidia bacterium]